MLCCQRLFSLAQPPLQVPFFGLLRGELRAALPPHSDSAVFGQRLSRQNGKVVVAFRCAGGFGRCRFLGWARAPGEKYLDSGMPPLPPRGRRRRER